MMMKEWAESLNIEFSTDRMCYFLKMTIRQPSFVDGSVKKVLFISFVFDFCIKKPISKCTQIIFEKFQPKYKQKITFNYYPDLRFLDKFAR